MFGGNLERARLLQRGHGQHEGHTDLRFRQTHCDTQRKASLLPFFHRKNQELCVPGFLLHRAQLGRTKALLGFF